MQFALTYASGAYDTRTKMMGRQAAGVGFLRAALNSRPQRLWCYAENRAQAVAFGQDVKALAPSFPEVRFIPWNDPGRLAQAGLLYRPDPGIGQAAWHRQAHAGARSYSLCGVTHTLSSLSAMAAVTDLLRSPLYPWDSVVCTSKVARDLFRNVLESEMDHLRSRFGATRFTLPQLPIIPLGVHARDFVFGNGVRAAGRIRLGIGVDDVAVLFAGRLTFTGKAHPLPMFLGLEAAAVRTGRPIHLLLFGRFPHERIGEVFRAEASRFAPSVRLVVLDGTKDEDRDAAWASSDLFTSLSDNIQETFGLTPVEAMAAGLPVVVSDWNGYKDTVRDGIDGFRIPTVAAPPGVGSDLADRFEMGLDGYDLYIGSVSQFVAVDIEAASDAYARLIGDPDLRRRMGDAGRRRVASHFDWSAVFRRYVNLWDELAERRRADPTVAEESRRSRRADRPDPFTLFRTFPSGTAVPESVVRLSHEVGLAEALERRKLDSVSFASGALPSDAAITEIMGHLSAMEWTSLADVARTVSPANPARTARSIVWLAKMGIVSLRLPPPKNGGTGV